MWMIPQLPSHDGATLWFAAFGEAPPAVAAVEVSDLSAGSSLDLRRFAPGWERVALGEPRVWTARVRLDGLAEDRRYGLQLRGPDGSAIDAPSSLRTLPRRLPAAGEAPFSILLGSCFDQQGDGRSGLPGLRRAVDGARLPHLKVLCGDQVYLDLPVAEAIPRDPPETYRHILGKYLRNWAPGGTRLASGFGDLLRQGANLFVSDDHEFWNNYPFSASHVPFTYRAPRRELLGGLATAFCRGFQAEPGREGGIRALQEVILEGEDGVGRLEIYGIDGRIERSDDYAHAHWPADMARLCERLRRLTSPAVVILSQPLFEPAQGIVRRRWVDAGLAEFADYEPLVAALAAAPHDVLVLSGDIHCGRIAETRLRSGRRIVEVVASPLSLIPRTSYYDKPADVSFPARPLLGARIPSSDVTMVRGPIRQDHAALLQLRAKGRRGVEAEVAFLPVGGRAPIDGRSSFSLT